MLRIIINRFLNLKFNPYLLFLISTHHITIPPASRVSKKPPENGKASFLETVTRTFCNPKNPPTPKDTRLKYTIKKEKT
jgi:hypothetical protein